MRRRLAAAICKRLQELLVCLRVLVGTIIAMPTIIDQQVRGTWEPPGDDGVHVALVWVFGWRSGGRLNHMLLPSQAFEGSIKTILHSGLCLRPQLQHHTASFYTS